MPEASVDKPEKKLTPVEGFKEASHGLHGPIGDELGDPIDHFTEESVQLLKHHGSYQQDDRDTRTARKKEGLGKDYKMMLRTKFPGGRVSREGYLICDELATKYGQDDIRVTSRQDFQFHGVVKNDFRPLIHDLNLLAKISTLGGCGDVVRNTMAAPVADIDQKYAECQDDLLALSQQISDYFMPLTTSYFDLWLNDEKATVNPDGTVTIHTSKPDKAPEEPIYGPTYLPRKFKIGIGTDFDNSVDVYTQDIGIIAHTEGGKIVGYEFLVGGGLGYTHRKPKTYARLATPLTYLENIDDIIPLMETVVKVQRDHGGRADRKHARLKYLIDDWGWEQFRATVFEYAGREYPEPRGITPTDQPDYLGWHKQIQDGLNYVGAWIENGRIRDFADGPKFKTGLRAVAEQFDVDIRCTPHHNIIFANVADAEVDKLQAVLDAHGIPTDKGISTIRRLEMACPALPLCGLAMSEAERAMPGIMEGLEAAGHGDADVLIRISGCPNNCSRPRSAEIGIVGSGADRHVLYVGGCYNGTRFCEPIAEKVPAKDLVAMIAALLDAWKAERNEGERFGDWSHRIGIDGLKPYIDAVSA
jgi:sulfite reductase beta subunit-like hemoprotein